jgi:hypothetical protein
MITPGTLQSRVALVIRLRLPTGLSGGGAERWGDGGRDLCACRVIGNMSHC